MPHMLVLDMFADYLAMYTLVCNEQQMDSHIQASFVAVTNS